MHVNQTVTQNIDLLWISLADENSEVPLAFLSEVIASKTCSELIMNTLQPMLTYIFIGVSRKSLIRVTEAAIFGLSGLDLDKHIYSHMVYMQYKDTIDINLLFSVFSYIYIHIYHCIRNNADVYMRVSPPKRPFFLFLFYFMQLLNVLLAIAMFTFLAKT